MNAIDVQHLTKSYRSQLALEDLSLALPAGQIVGLMGDNGSGKTTLFKILAGVLSQWTGDVTIAGHRPGPQSKAVVSYLPDESFLPDRYTTDQAVRAFADFFADFDEERAASMIEFFRLPAGRSLKELSKGMREKLQIALAMSRRARVYLLDEPISGVDPAARTVILDGIIRHFDPEALMVISTHLIADIETVMDSVVFLRGGRVLLHGGVDELREEHHTSIDKLFREVYA